MAIDLQKLISIYSTYGFEANHESEDVICFIYRKSRYFGVDIIPLTNSDDLLIKTDALKKKYSDAGYAVDIKNLLSVEDAEKELYKSFFSYEASLGRLRKKYQTFSDKQTKALLGSKYEYIESPFDIIQGSEKLNEYGLLENLQNIINGNRPQLIIIEAAAGYGKTCAAYEILNRITSNQVEYKTPLFTELSKNRGAKIFRYILLDEIDFEFPTLNSGLVVHEIKNGRIPLIIDGFDELLEKVNVSDSDSAKTFDEVETMLDTIGNLLENNAKIILTTRRTAIFGGVEFDQWAAKWENKFDVTRILLKDPKIKDWIGEERYEAVKSKDIPIQYIANPVLLTYLKNLAIQDFSLQIEHPDLLIDQYFNRLLEREKERQNLIITVEKQKEIFKNVVKLLLDFDITVESKQFFKELIKEHNSRLLEYTQTLYSGANKPSLENLIDTLATHALLDRKGRDENQIGFINDFVLGIFIGEIICETSVEKIAKDYSYYMVDLACTAYKVQNRHNKAQLWDKINAVTYKLQPISIFSYDVSLKESLQRDYKELTVYDNSFFHIDFSGKNIDNSAFLNCYFRACQFDTSILNGVSFVDCTFDQCTVNNEKYLDEGKNIATIKCKLKECDILMNYAYHINDESSPFNELEIKILQNLLGKVQHIVKLFRCLDSYRSKQVVTSLHDLEGKGFVDIRGSQIYINMNRIHFVKQELGIK